MDKQTSNISYFSDKQFSTVLQRAEHYNIGVFGIEIVNSIGVFQGVRVFEDYGTSPTAKHWYWSAFKELKGKYPNSLFSASFGLDWIH